MLPTGRHVAEAVLGPGGVAEALDPAALLIDMSTGLPAHFDATAERLADSGRRMIDAPVGRTSADAEAGTLLIMAGGSPEELDQALPVLEHLGDPVIHCGPRGAGIRTKLVNNYLSVVSNVVVAEALTLAESQGLDRDLVIEVLMGTTAGQGHLATTYPAKVLAGRPGSRLHDRPGPQGPGPSPPHERRSRLRPRHGPGCPGVLLLSPRPRHGKAGLDRHLQRSTGVERPPGMTS